MLVYYVIENNINKTQIGKTFFGLASLRYRKLSQVYVSHQMTMIMLTLNSFFGLAMGLLIPGNYNCIGYLEGGHLRFVIGEKLGFVKVFKLRYFFTTIDNHRRN